MPQCDEVWSGIEYQVAAHLIYEGLTDQGLEIVRAARARHDGYRRSPWNESEAGYHYARSMASWAVLLAYSGFHYDGHRNAIGFAPAAGDIGFRCFFSTGSGWGTFTQDTGAAELELIDGSLPLSQIRLRTPAGSQVSVSVSGRSLQASVVGDGQHVDIGFARTSLTAGERLRVSFR